MAYVRTRLGRWFYEERGAARSPGDPAILLLHGLLFDGGMWTPCVAPLAELGRVLVIDGPGHGKSEVPPPFTLEDHAEALVDAMRELGVDKAILVGLSWGGMLAMRVALAHPSRVAAMVLLDTSAEVDGPVDRLKYAALVALAATLGLPEGLYQREISPLMFCGKTLRERPQVALAFARRVNGFPRRGIARASNAVVIRRTNILSKLGAIRVPTLVLCGREDRATAPARGEAIAASIHGARFAWIADAGHMSVVEQPDAVIEAILPFVRGELHAAAVA